MFRWKAAAIHLTISLVLATIVGALIYFLWFPPPYFSATGAVKLFIVLMGVDISVGPLLTFLVFSPRKRRTLLKLDLSIIAAIQVIAFAYGIHVISAARPVFVVADIDRLVVLAADELADTDLAQGSQAAFRTRSWTGPILVGVMRAKDYKGLNPLDLTLGTGKDMDQLPRFYVPYDQVAGGLMRHAKPISKIRKITAQQRALLNHLRNSVDDGDAFVALPLTRGDFDYTAIMSPKTERPVRILPIDPW
jgi:hypothetical protein